jgi:hypothetical protein
VSRRGCTGYRRVVSYLTEELVRLGHEITLFDGDSQTAARVACAPRPLRLDPEVTDALPHHLLMIERVRRRVHEFDVLHFHVEHVRLPLFRPYAHKCVTTRLDLLLRRQESSVAVTVLSREGAAEVEVVL